MNIDDYIREQAQARTQYIETAVEKALQGGVCGVKVVYRLGLFISAEVDPSVPYGEIHEHLL
jgi:hypothetical protein